MTMASFPVLTMFDHLISTGPDGVKLADRPDAARLELHARVLAETYWSEHVWLTGQVSEAAFRAVYEALLAEMEPDESKRRFSIVELVRERALPPLVAARLPERWRVAS
jgi:hypothetical protein